MNKFLFSKYRKNKIANILSEYNYQIKIGDILAGKIIGKERKEILIDLGLEKAAFLLKKEISSKYYAHTGQIEFITEFIILYHNCNSNLIIVSLQRLYYLRLWERFKQIDFNNMILFTKLKQSIWGGKLIEFDDLNCFIPNFHLPKHYRRQELSNCKLTIKILEVKNWKHNIIGSSRLAIFKKYSPSLFIGLVQICYIIGIKPFGIFLNIYGFRSLLHISEISHKKIKNISNIYKKGDQIKVKIIYINNSKGKVAVSMK